ncbi:MAG: cobalt ECF transporter T component CbiQ [Anaerolineae bacterium]|jgi:cobalt/nickel transport system permease protein
MRHSFLDRYRQGTSLVHQLDPRLKLLATLAFVLVVTTTPPGHWLLFALLAALACGAVLTAQVPLVEGLKRSAIVLPFVGMVAISLPFTQAGDVVWSWRPFDSAQGGLFGFTLTITDGGLALFATVMIKAWLSVMVSGLLVATTPFPDLLKAMRSLHIPAVLTATISFMYRYLFVLIDEAMRLQTARAARSVGTGRTVWWRAQVLGGMIGSLFIRSYERSERIYAAMLSRGFSGEVRTLTHLRWQTRDTWVGLAWVIALVAIVILGRAVLRLPI